MSCLTWPVSRMQYQSLFGLCLDQQRFCLDKRIVTFKYKTWCYYGFSRSFKGFYSSLRTTFSPCKALEARTINICRSGSWATQCRKSWCPKLPIQYQHSEHMLRIGGSMTSQATTAGKRYLSFSVAYSNWQRHVCGMSVLWSHTIIHSHWWNEILTHSRSRPFGCWHHAMWIECSIKNFEYKLRQNTLELAGSYHFWWSTFWENITFTLWILQVSLAWLIISCSSTHHGFSLNRIMVSAGS